MKFVKQQIKEFTQTNLVDIYDDWSPTTTYILETDNDNLTNASVVRYGTYYYRSVTNDNIGYNPVEYENIKWVKYKVSNKYAMLDMSANSESIVEGGDMVVTFLQEYSDTLIIGNYEAKEVLVEVINADESEVLWNTLPSTINLLVYDYWSYIYEPYSLDVKYTTKIDIPVAGKYIRVTFKKLTQSNRASCGFLVAGYGTNMGKSLMGVNFSYNSFTTKEISSFGNLEIKKGAIQDILDFETVIASTELRRMRRVLKNIYDEIVVFIVDERDVSPYESIVTLGVIQDASVILENHIESVMSFSVIEAV